MDIRTKQKRLTFVFIFCFLVVGLHQKSWEWTEWREDDITLVSCIHSDETPFQFLLDLNMYTSSYKNHSIFIRMESPHTPKTVLMSQYSCTKASRLTLTCKEDPNTAGKGDHFNFLCCKHIHILFFSPNCLQLGVHFAMKGSLPLVPLASYEGSGNTWARYLIEQLTGLFTGDMYCVRQSIKCEMKFGTDIFSLHSNPGGKLGTRVRCR